MFERGLPEPGGDGVGGNRVFFSSNREKAKKQSNWSQKINKRIQT